MTDIKPILNATITIEFFVGEDKKIHLLYNRNEYLLSEFWHKVQDAEHICKYILQQFSYEFPEKYKKANQISSGWKETFIKVINNHFRIYNTKFDVFIRHSGDVIFNLEYN